MATYELDDDLVRQLLRNPDRLPRALVQALEKQLPLPVPTKIGAVVRTGEDHRGPQVWIRWAPDAHSTTPWIRAVEMDGTYRTDEIGRIVEELAPGVDL